jgi:hypothetical protein
MKRMLLLLALMSSVGIALPAKAVASQTIVGRIADYNATSLSVQGREIVTVTLDNRTTYTKWITQKPWGEDTRLTAALGLGRLVSVHRGKDNGSVADWVQIATDMPSVAPAVVRSPAFSTPQAGAPAPTASKVKASDLLTSKQVKALIATANTPADHMKLQKHFLALAAKYEADAIEHAAEAEAYRKNPTFMESKNPVGPGTVTHCDRFAQLDREAAKEARDLASAHEHMAAAK